MILLEAQHGREVDGNIYYILKELMTDERYDSYKVYLCANNEHSRLRFLKKIDGFIKSNFEIVIRDTKEYYKIISSAKYLVNDNTFLPFFIKKTEQVYLNTWHGTPLKTLGKKDRTNLHLIGNAQKNFFIADYLLYPNEYTMYHMLSDYMVPNISKSKILLGGYPRNSEFYLTSKKCEIIKDLCLENKKVYAYMPTWRSSAEKDLVYLKYYLYEIDRKLQENECFFVKLHPIAKKKINFNLYTKIKVMPDMYECYEFLNIADCLITDYSSVMYDFAVTGKKIVLFTYDKDEYLQTRGLYEPLESLPFDKADNIDGLLSAIRSPKQYDDKEFVEKYCSYESVNSAKYLCEHVILEEKKLIEKSMPTNGKENILLYAGNLAQNGITTSLMNLLSSIDTNEYNYYITFKGKAAAANKETLFVLPNGVEYIACMGKMNLGLIAKIAHILYGKRYIPFWLYWEITQHAFKYENKRLYGDIKFKTVIHFNGYEYKKILAFSQLECNRVIYVHTDMIQEIATRGNQRKAVLKYAYNKYDKVGVVTEDIKESTYSISNNKENINVIHNIIAFTMIKEKSKNEMYFDDNTVCNIDFYELKTILNKEGNYFFVNVARYSPEKGQKRLIDAFCNIWRKNHNAYLIIIGGNQFQGMRDQLIAYTNTLECRENVIFILRMSNPFPLIKKCDSFVLSSFYEGFGLVLAEANILGLPIISTDITGPRGFMNKYGGRLVDNTEQGIYNGMKDLMDNKIGVIDVDYDKYNDNAVKEFSELLK